jgi:DNA-directed RNA polymerase subunit RPC12/RpoP
MSIKKPKIAKCTYCGQELTPINLYENVWRCEFCGFFFRVYNGKPFPKLGYFTEEVVVKEEQKEEEVSGNVCRRCGKPLRYIAEQERGICFDCWAEFSKVASASRPRVRR